MLKEDTFEIYLSGTREWTSLEQLQAFLKKIEEQYSFLNPGFYLVLVTTNELGTLFFIEQVENYVYKKSVDLKIKLEKSPFYLKSPTASIFQKDCFYFQNFFYGKSYQLTSHFTNFDWIERVFKDEYEEAKRKGIAIKKRRECSSL